MKTKIDKELLVHLPNEVKEMNLPPKAQEIYCNFIPMSNNEGWCYSTVNGLAKELQCSTRSIMSNIKLLENKKLILERVIGKKGVATRFRIKLFNENESDKDGNENENAFNENECNSLNNTEMYGNENENAFDGNENAFNGNENAFNENAFDGNLSIEQVILLKFKELEGLINKYIESRKMGEKIDYGHLKENKIKEKKLKEINNNNNNSYTNSSNNIQEVNNTDIDIKKKKKEDINLNNKENIEIDKKEDIDKSTCKYKRRKQNDYQFTVEEKDDYNEIVENTKVEGVVSKSDGNTSKSKKFLYLLKGSTSKFSYFEALEYVDKNNLNFDECFEKVEVTD